VLRAKDGVSEHYMPYQNKISSPSVAERTNRFLRKRVVGVEPYSSSFGLASLLKHVIPAGT
jgi:hypothetical protein